MIEKGKHKLVWQFPNSFAMIVQIIITLLKKKKREKMILIPAKSNHKCRNVFNILPSRLFSKTFPNEFLFSHFWFKNKKKINKFGLSYHRHMIQPSVLRILRCSL